MTNNKLIIILGQTSTGKSDFAVQIAKEIKGEIISADSRQVYKGMNLGTGKIIKKEMQKIPHHLLDVISPKKIFSVNNFQKMTHEKIKEIFKRNNIPIICGGTGFYIDAVTNNTIFPEVPPNYELRTKLEKKTTEQLSQMLEKLDINRYKNIDKNNRVRLIRAIEIAKALGKIPPPSPKPRLGPDFETLKIGLGVPDEILKDRIKTRLLYRIKKGMIKEIKDLHEKEKVSWKRLESFGLEYRYISEYLQKSKGISPIKRKELEQEIIEKLNTAIWHFAKRQNTWFKRDKEIIWINPLKKKEQTEALKKIKSFLK